MTVKSCLTSTVKSPWYSGNWKREIQSQKSIITKRVPSRWIMLRELYQLSLNIFIASSYYWSSCSKCTKLNPLLSFGKPISLSIRFNKKEGEILTFNDIYRSFMRRVEKRQIKLRILPLVTTSIIIAPLLNTFIY